MTSCPRLPLSGAEGTDPKSVFKMVGGVCGYVGAAQLCRTRFWLAGGRTGRRDRGTIRHFGFAAMRVVGGGGDGSLRVN